jgi:hypothetical protein
MNSEINGYSAEIDRSISSDMNHKRFDLPFDGNVTARSRSVTQGSIESKATVTHGMQLTPQGLALPRPRKVRF